MRKYQVGNVCFSSKTKLFLSENADDVKMAGKKQENGSHVEKMMKNVDIDEPSFLDHVHLGCTQRSA